MYHFSHTTSTCAISIPHTAMYCPFALCMIIYLANWVEPHRPSCSPPPPHGNASNVQLSVQSKKVARWLKDKKERGDVKMFSVQVIRSLRYISTRQRWFVVKAVVARWVSFNKTVGHNRKICRKASGHSSCVICGEP